MVHHSFMSLTAHSTAQHNMAQHSTAWHGEHSTAWRSTAQHSTAQIRSVFPPSIYPFEHTRNVCHVICSMAHAVACSAQFWLIGLCDKLAQLQPTLLSHNSTTWLNKTHACLTWRILHCSLSFAVLQNIVSHSLHAIAIKRKGWYAAAGAVLWRKDFGPEHAMSSIQVDPTDWRHVCLCGAKGSITVLRLLNLARDKVEQQTYKVDMSSSKPGDTLRCCFSTTRDLLYVLLPREVSTSQYSND